MDTGKIQETDTKRTAPLTLVEALVIMMKLSFQVPLAFFVAILPQSVFGIVNSALTPLFTGKFTRGIFVQDSAMAMNGLVMLIILYLISPLMKFVGNYTEAYFVKKMISVSRRKMLRSTLKGGTQFGEKFRPGKLIDSFSSQLVQVELYTINLFITIVPQIVSMASGVYVSAKVYPPAVYIFISLLPVILSVEYFEDRASRASAKKTETDAMLSGKVNSAVDCRDAIRAANASEWIAKDMKDLLDATDRTHFASFFRSGLSGNFIEIVSAIYTVLIILPLGIAVVNQQMGLDTFMIVSTAMVSEKMCGLASVLITIISPLTLSSMK
jgi:ABC-type multidrug transport system fused ATPase/permease subunit